MICLPDAATDEMASEVIPAVTASKDLAAGSRARVEHFTEGLTTPEGITVGSTVADLQAVFGDQLRLFAEPDECTGTWLFSIGSTALGLEGELGGPPSDGSSPIAGLGAGARSTCQKPWGRRQVEREDDGARRLSPSVPKRLLVEDLLL
ncbi:MAG: hypothetical protein OES24_07600 [Acidimicrobiia bacterium]|nr:hypothetical protein [Acidimicrobiia bacterium]